jgi:ArsR family metal-binding transcriptional regulator
MVSVGTELLKSIEIEHVLPCLADPDKIRVIAQADADMSEALPYMNALVKNCIYNHEGKTLTLKKGHRIINIFGYRVTIAKADNVADARQTLDWLRDLVNKCWARRDEIEPDYSRRDRLTPLDVLRLLPLTNCRKCGEKTCTAFAVRLAAEEISIARCAELFNSEWRDRRALLLQLLRNSGYDVPSAFAPEKEYNGEG